MSAPTVSVVVCCYTADRWHDVVDAVKSLTEQTVTPAETLLVVDHNQELLRRAMDTFDGVRVVGNTGRQGLSGARNTGVRLATGEIVAFLDDDAAADPEWLATMIAPYTDHAVAAVGGRALPVWPDGRAPALLPPELYWVVGCGFTGQPVELSEVRNVMGCAMSFRRELISQLGGFAEDIGRTTALPLGCEETELCIRLRQRIPGATVLLQPAATVRHQVSADRVRWRYLVRRSWSEGLSKAAIARMIGPQDALSTERSYLSSVIPRALARSVIGTLRGRTGSPAAAGALLLATSAAAAGYLVGRTRSATGRPDQDKPFTATEVLAVDVADGTDGVPTGNALALVRSGELSLGTVRLPGEEAELRELAAAAPAQAAARPPLPDVLPRVSVVLATAGSPALAARCVRSVLATGYPDLEVLVVDNHPGSPCAPLRELAETDDRIHYLREPTPGASRARNRGVAEATGSVIAFTDDDAVVDVNWLHETVREMSVHSVDCVTGLVMPMCLDTPAQQWFEAFGGFGKGYQRTVYHPDSPAADPLYPLSPGVFGSGNNMAWRRDSFLAAGGFDERLGPGRRTRSGEDLDLYLRLITSGGRLVYTPHALVWHEHRPGESELRGQLRGYGTGLAAIFLLHALRPGGLGAIVRRLPTGLRKLLAAGSDRNVTRGPGYPKRLVLDEWRGMLAGPATLVAESVRRPQPVLARRSR